MMRAALILLAMVGCAVGKPRPPVVVMPTPIAKPPAPVFVADPVTDPYLLAVLFGADGQAEGVPTIARPHLPARWRYATDDVLAPVCERVFAELADCTGGQVRVSRVPASEPSDIQVRFDPEQRPDAAALCWPAFDAKGYLTGAALVFYSDGRWFDARSLEHESLHAIGLWHSPDPTDRMGTRRADGYGPHECAAWRYGAEHLPVGTRPDGRLGASSARRPTSIPMEILR